MLVQFFQHFEHADVCRAARAAAAENEADAWALRRIASREGHAGKQHEKDGQAAEEGGGFHAEPLRELIGRPNSTAHPDHADAVHGNSAGEQGRTRASS